MIAEGDCENVTLDRILSVMERYSGASAITSKGVRQMLLKNGLQDGRRLNAANLIESMSRRGKAKMNSVVWEGGWMRFSVFPLYGFRGIWEPISQV
jgi:riboflavin biosynthesis pyrimidine reductase